MKIAITVSTLFVLMGCLVSGEDSCSSLCALGICNFTAGRSCNDIYQSVGAARGVSGYYWIKSNTGVVQQVYGDMELECGGHKGGWMRVAKVDTANGEACPGEWINNVKYNSLCTGTGGAGCYSANFTVPYAYNKICGQLRGFQKGSPDSFYPYFSARGSTPSDLYRPLSSSTNVNGVYVDGVSVTFGEPRKHVWTYAIGLNDDYTNGRGYGLGYFHCPCSKIAATGAPVFVGNNYYCESGNADGKFANKLFSDDPLWDGKQCLPGNSCCDRTGQPWFFYQLPISVNEHLEARICQDQVERDEAVTVDKLELFIQ